MSHDDPKRRMFVASLAKLVSPLEPSSATNALMAFLPGLGDLSDAIFDKPGELAIAIAANLRGVPTYGALRKAIEAWARETLTALAGLMPPDLVEAPMSAEDRANVAVWLQHDARGDLSENDMVLRLSVIRRYAHKGYDWLMQHNHRAALIAVSRKWDTPPREAPADDDEKDRVTEIVRSMRIGAQDVALGAPDVPIDPAVLTERFRAQTGRSPGEVSPEVLAQVRANNANIQAALVQQRAMQAEREAAGGGKRKLFPDDGP